MSGLDPAVRRDLHTMPKELAEWVGRHLVMASRLLEVDPATALAHAQAARSKASRLAVVREAVGIAAYYAGEWQTALTELRAARRMSGAEEFLPMIIDSERALGREERAWVLYEESVAEVRDPAVKAELVVIAAGMKRDGGDPGAAIELLRPLASSSSNELWVARACYAYADLLMELGRAEEAREWFTKAADVDRGGFTDAAERLMEMEGFDVSFTDPDADTPAAQ